MNNRAVHNVLSYNIHKTDGENTLLSLIGQLAIILDHDLHTDLGYSVEYIRTLKTSLHDQSSRELFTETLATIQAERVVVKLESNQT